jgi:hypothetical protein
VKAPSRVTSASTHVVESAEALRVLRQALDNYAQRARDLATGDVAQADAGLRRTFLLEEARARRLRAAVTQLSPPLLAWAMKGAVVDVDGADVDQVTNATEGAS